MLIAVATLTLTLSLFAGCTPKADKPPVVNNTEFKIETINLENQVNFTGRVTFEKALELKYEGQQVEYFGEKLVAKIKFSQKLPTGKNISTSNLAAKTSIEEIIKKANPNLDLKVEITKDELEITVSDSVEATEDKEYEIIIPKTIQSVSGKTLKEDSAIKLKMKPHTFVKAVNKSKSNPLFFDGTYNTYYINVQENSSLAFYLQFNNDIDKEEVLKKAKEACDSLNATYKWITDKELKIYLPKIKVDEELKIDLTDVIDKDGDKLYTSPVISILVGK